MFIKRKQFECRQLLSILHKHLKIEQFILTVFLYNFLQFKKGLFETIDLFFVIFLIVSL